MGDETLDLVSLLDLLESNFVVESLDGSSFFDGACD